MTALRIALAAFAAVLLAGCQPGETGAGAPSEPAKPQAQSADAAVPDAASAGSYDGIADDEVLRFTGTEPFWGGQVDGQSLTYTTPEDQQGTAIAVERFAGRGGIAFSGLLGSADFEMAVTALDCSDGMSDRTYPFTVTLEIGEDKRNGCAWSEQHPFAGSEHP